MQASDATTLDAQLESTRTLLDQAAAQLEGDLDGEQLQLYDLAFCEAEWQAARIARQSVSQPKLDTAFHRRLADTFTASALTTIQERLTRAPEDYGLTDENLAPLPPEVRRLVSAPALAELGQTLMDRNGLGSEAGLDEEKKLMRDSFEQFGAEVVAPQAEAIHREDLLIPDSILEPLKAMGCFGLSVPERFGGLKPDGAEDSLGMVVVTQALSKASLGAAGSLITRPEIMARAILEGGTEAQKQRWLPGIAAGEPLAAVAVTEPNTGSDVASVSLRATPTEGGWLLNGAKTWCTFGGKAGSLLVLARTNPDPSLKHRGLSLFVVSKPSDDGETFAHHQSDGGRLTGRAIATLGYRGMHSFELFFDDYFVPDSDLIGEQSGVGRGFYYTMRGFMGGRLQTAARACGVMEAAFEAALAYANTRQAFGRTLASFSLTKIKLARMATTLFACEQSTYEVARLMDAGEGAMEASLIKLMACRHAEAVTREAMQLHGGMGYAEESAVSRYFVDARVLSIFEGAEETLAIRVVGKALIDATRRPLQATG